MLFIALSFIILIKLSSFIADVLSEDTIIKWYKEAHSVKGKSVFLEQMSKFIEWLQSAEEGKEYYYQNEFLTVAKAPLSF